MVEFQNILYLCEVQNDMSDLTLHSNTESFIGDIKRLVEQGRNAAYGAVNAVMIETYWRIGQIVQARLHNLKWSHILTTLRVEDPVAARWYLQTASQEMWSVRPARTFSLLDSARQ